MPDFWLALGNTFLYTLIVVPMGQTLALLLAIVTTRGAGIPVRHYLKVMVAPLGFLLVSGAALFTLTATMAKISDRMAEQAPHTLDGMAFMPYAVYTDEWGPMALEQDYQAIRWLQENVKGSPVIVEANLRNLYRWGSRMTIYTGLPGVVGWEWHQQQQRAVVPGIWVSNRIAEVDAFYLTTDLQEAASFLRKYQVRYIILGQQERGHYAGPGLEKFSDLNGLLWQEVFRYQDTVIYAVLDLDQIGALP